MHTTLIKKYKYIIIAALGVLAAYVLVMAGVELRLSELRLQTQLIITEHETQLATIAEITARNGADATTERMIRDCTIAERTRFDELLVRLDSGLSRVELTELERLFGRCGNFFAERKAVMVARLAREIEIYEEFVRQLGNLTGADESETYQVPEWKELASLEQKQSELFSELVSQQDLIISNLLSGKSPDSEEITTVLQNVSQIQETLVVTNKQATALRTTLVSL